MLLLILALAVCGALLIYSCTQIEREKVARVVAEIELVTAQAERDTFRSALLAEQGQRRNAENRNASYIRLANQRLAQLRVMEEHAPQPHQILPTLVRPAVLKAVQ